ncbi:hypothetical protein Tco_1469281, partial [Tanacetum coccineum]
MIVDVNWTSKDMKKVDVWDSLDTASVQYYLEKTDPESIILAASMRLFSSFITIAKGGSSLIFTLSSLPAGAELTFKVEELLLSLARAEDGSFIMTPFKVSALNVDFDLKIDLIVFGLEIGSAPSNFFSRGRG